MFLIEWLYMFLQTFNIKNSLVQLFLQILASLLFQKHEPNIIHESQESNSIIESNKEEIKSVKDHKSDKIIALNSESFQHENQSTSRNVVNKYIIEDGKAIFPFFTFCIS